MQNSKEKSPPKWPTEHAEQVTLVQWFDAAYPQYAGRLFAIPNGGWRAKAQAIKLQLEGVRSGVPDLFLPVPANGKHGLFIEMKRTKGGRLTPEQREWLKYLCDAGYAGHCCAGFESARKAVELYITLQKKI